MGEMTVPLVDRGNGLWGSSSPAWDHLINRESSGRPTIVQQIHDVNSGGNEAEGLFQITPKTWRSNGGSDFATSARLATPQQQAIVAARIFTRNPTGSDWGAGRPGRETAHDLAAGLVPVSAPPPSRPVEPYGMPNGSNSGGYGNSGVKFPDWVYALGNAFGLKPSTYPGHQESDRNEAGYAPNPQHQNRGIDWASPGAADEVDRMQRFADYLFSIRGELEQVIWWNPRTNKRIGVAGGKDVTTTPYYDYPGGYDDHRDHVHTRCSHSIPLPGGVGTVTTPSPPVALRPDFVELDFYSSKKVGQGFSARSRKPINFFIHTEEGNGTAESLARFCDGSNGVSYHYTVRDGKVCDVVDTDYYSWSVLSANVFSINLCFAGSFAGWSRDQWLQRERDIEIAAYLAVQDCHKYGIPTTVIAPPYHEAAGISDHKYVTQQLHIGTHTDVGNQFPWDVFTRYVAKYANPAQPSTSGEDMALVDQQVFNDLVNKVNRLHDAVLVMKYKSLAPLREPGQGEVGTLIDILRWMDGNVHEVKAIREVELGAPTTVALVERVADMNLAQFTDRTQFDKELAEQILADASAPKGVVVQTVSEAPAAPAPVVDTRELTAAYQEIARLREENARLQAAVQVQVPVSTEVAVPSSGTAGERIGGLVDAVKDGVELALAMNTTERAALASSVQILQIDGGKA